jgi:hypothetical protein
MGKIDSGLSSLASQKFVDTIVAACALTQMRAVKLDVLASNQQYEFVGEEARCGDTTDAGERGPALSRHNQRP